VRVASERVASLAAGVDLAAARAALSRAPRQLDALEALAAGERPAPSLHAPALRALVQRGFARVASRDAPRDVLGAPLEAGRRLELTPDQALALAPIESAVRRRDPQTFLLHGVTGSGKTEVYLRAVAAALDAGRRALVLVPEITLTHQILARLRGRFGDNLAVLHSGLRPGERLEQWLRLARGGAPIAVGARSALFAPLDDLGVIVIDEEHDGAYKNEEGFRYHARTWRACARAPRGCPVVLGSATPSLEARYAADRGEITRIVLAHRIGGQPLPAVEIVDLARERESAPRGRKLILSRPLRAALAETLRARGQAILFPEPARPSRRGSCASSAVHAERCADCDVGLVYHAADGALHCHTASTAGRRPSAARAAARPTLRCSVSAPSGSRRRCARSFPHARIARLDRDTAAGRGATERVLRRLRDGELDVLIGTQMVAKDTTSPASAWSAWWRRTSASTCPTSARPSAPSSCSPRSRDARAATARPVA
jgi:primosomal protein N' (replication factor Y)